MPRSYYSYGYVSHPIPAGVTIGHDGREHPAYLVVIRCTPIKHTLIGRAQ